VSVSEGKGKKKTRKAQRGQKASLVGTESSGGNVTAQKGPNRYVARGGKAAKRKSIRRRSQGANVYWEKGLETSPHKRKTKK